MGPPRGCDGVPTPSVQREDRCSRGRPPPRPIPWVGAVLRDKGPSACAADLAHRGASVSWLDSSPTRLTAPPPKLARCSAQSCIHGVDAAHRASVAARSRARAHRMQATRI